MAASTDAPRLLAIDLAQPGRARLRAWESADPLLDRVGGAGGVALALAWLLEREDPRDAFALCVGPAVVSGLPTAARATLLAAAPAGGRASDLANGRLATGQVGGELGRRLARVADAVCLFGRTELAGAVLVLDEGGARVESVPELLGADIPARQRRIEERFGPCASLCAGPAAEHGVPFANLAAAEGSTTSFVGRGLGAALAARGLAAVCLLAPPVRLEPSEPLVRALASSPRLVARGEGGTLELAAAFAARGDLRGPAYAEPLARETGETLASEAGAARRERHGCKGCPTPCGWVFEREDGTRGGAHFSAVYALGTNLGLAGFDDAAGLLACCDRLGLDAREAGARLAAWGAARASGELDGGAVWGTRTRFEEALEELAAGVELGGERARTGSKDTGPTEAGSGQARAGPSAPVRREASLAAVLGQCAGVRGADPLRTFPFLVADGIEHARLARLVAPLPLPAGAEDPTDPAGKGRLLWWHENLVGAIDATGFCAFSAAGLLADGVCDPDTLARWIAPPWLPGATDASFADRLLALGATLTGLQKLLDERLGARPDPPPEWAARDLVRPGMLDEYRRLRGLDTDGRLTDEARGRLGTLRAIEHGLGPESAASPTSAPVVACGVGRVELRASGSLAARLGGALSVELPLPASLAAVMEAARAAAPVAGDWLVRGGEPLPAVYRAGRRVTAGAAVSDGDVLDLVLVVAGG